MPRKRRQDDPIPFGIAYAQSETFRTMFRDGMRLVEETADYLDGEGRAAARALGRPASIVYATESMRLTTRLMQLASWLLLHRAVKEGEMSLAQASKEKTKVRLTTADRGDADSIALLPERLQDLIARSKKLQAEVLRLDATIHAPVAVPQAWNNPVERQLGLLKAAFEQGRV